MDVIKVTEVQYIHKCVYNITYTLKSIQRHNICLTNSDNDYIIDEIKQRGKLSMKEISILKMMQNKLF